MEDVIKRCKIQCEKARALLVILEKQRDEIYTKINSINSDPILQIDLRSINLDIQITLNEIEHAEYVIQECESNNNSILK